MQASQATVSAYGEFLARAYPWEYFHTCTLDNVHSQAGERILQGHVHRYLWRLFHESAVRIGGAERIMGTAREKDPRTGLTRTARRAVAYRGPLAKAYKRQPLVRPVYVFAIEPHKSNQLHVHAMSYFPRYFYVNERPDVSLPWQQSWIDYPTAIKAWGWGRIKLERPRCQEAVCEYVAKYLSKLGEVEFSRTFESGRRRMGQLAHRVGSTWSAAPGLPGMAEAPRKVAG